MGKKEPRRNDAVARAADILLGGKTWIRTARGVTTRQGIITIIEEQLAFSLLLSAAKCAWLDLNGEREADDISMEDDTDHPMVKTLNELDTAIKIVDPDWKIVK